jgi:6-pyruvoyltetrahydropterin/6-carboxytetrahydropterin synthase
MKCVIDRRAQFSASHRYWLPELSEAENAEQFGACAKFPGHGHNYTLHVSMLGELDEYGMVLNLSEVKHVIKQEVTAPLDYAFLNDAWDEFRETLPTTENIARVIWNKLSPHLPIVNIRLYEHPQLWADYQGKDMEAFLTVSTHFSAAHRLARTDLSFEENSTIYGKCARPNGHGHNYHLDVMVKGQIDPRTGMSIDLGKLQAAINECVVEPMDHTFLNKDISYFEKVVPTAENIAFYICQVLEPRVRELGAELHKVKLCESPNNACEVYASGSTADDLIKMAQRPQLAAV